MEEKIIKWSSKTIIWTTLLCLIELAFLLWILSQGSTCGIGGIKTLCLILNHHCWMDFV